ncbi:MAG: lipoprotein [Rikenellaceae bacterium]
MQKVILYITALLTLTGCFKDVSYNTTIVLRPTQQIASGGDAIELPGVVAYAFVADTTYFTVTSYEMAMQGVMVEKETGEEISAFASSAPYDDSDNFYENSIALQVDQNEGTIAIVAIDTLNGDYGYTTYSVGVNLSTTYLAVNFAPWKEGKFEYGKWCFVVGEPYTGPDVPEVENPEIEVPEIEDEPEVEEDAETEDEVEEEQTDQENEDETETEADQETETEEVE